MSAEQITPGERRELRSVVRSQIKEYAEALAWFRDNPEAVDFSWSDSVAVAHAAAIVRATLARLDERVTGSSADERGEWLLVDVVSGVAAVQLNGPRAVADAFARESCAEGRHLRVEGVRAALAAAPAAPDTDDVTEAIEWLQSRYHLDDLDRDYSRTAAMVDVLVRAVRAAPAVPAAPVAAELRSIARTLRSHEYPRSAFGDGLRTGHLAAADGLDARADALDAAVRAARGETT